MWKSLLKNNEKFALSPDEDGVIIYCNETEKATMWRTQPLEKLFELEGDFSNFIWLGRTNEIMVKAGLIVWIMDAETGKRKRYVQGYFEH